MKPFNLERALAGDPVITKKSKKIVEIVHLKEMNQEGSHCVIAVTHDQEILFCTINGKYIKGEEHDKDLFMAPKIQKYYLDIYKNEGGILYFPYTPRLEPNENFQRNENYIKTIIFEIEE